MNSTWLSSGRTGAVFGVLASGASSFALRIVGLASAFVLGVILARSLGPADYGVYGLVIAVSALAMNLALLGTPQLAVREMAVRSASGDWVGADGLARSFHRTTALMAAAILVVAVAAAAILRPGDHRILGLTLTGGLLTAATSAVALKASELRGLGRMVQGQFMDIVGRPLAAALIIGAALLAGWRLGAASALIVQLAVAVAALLVSTFWLRRALPRPDHLETVAPRQWIGLAIPLGIVDVLRQLDGTYGMVLMGWLASATELGVYRVALSAAVLMTMPVTILHIVLAPAVSRHFRFGETDQLQQLLRRASLAMTAALLPMVLLFALVGKWLVVLVFGAAYAGAATPLLLIGVAQLVLGVFGMGPILLAMANAERALTRIYLLSVTIGMAAAVPLVIRYGAAGAAGAQILSSAMIAGLSHFHARRTMGLALTFFGRAPGVTR